MSPRRPGAGIDHGGVHCPACGKLAFLSRKSAKRAVRRMRPGSQVRFYRCGESWHFTSQDAETVAWYRERDAQAAK